MRYRSFGSVVAWLSLASLGACGGDDNGAAGGADAGTTQGDAASEGKDGATPSGDAQVDAPENANDSSVQHDGAGDASRWSLVWSDEFNGADGSAVDASKWTALVGGDGWGNQEREYYTADLANAAQQGGSLVITATTAGAAAHMCWYGACQYTSARLQTKGKFDRAYGRFEARIKIPRGQGLWPAFWMLGNNIDAVTWPTCGEIDILENIGKEPATVHGSLHGPGYSGASPLTATHSLAMGALADAFHVYAVEWETNVVRFYLDDVLYETRTPADVPAGKTWVYDHPFFVLLNVAVGGTFPGDPDNTSQFPQTMQVDYVRVYQ